MVYLECVDEHMIKKLFQRIRTIDQDQVTNGAGICYDDAPAHLFAEVSEHREICCELFRVPRAVICKAHRMNRPTGSTGGYSSKSRAKRSPLPRAPLGRNRGCVCRAICYKKNMPVTPMPIRMEKELMDLLSEGARRTPHKKQELVRLTLRRHLREVIDTEAVSPAKGRITNIEPWPKGMLTAIYKETACEGWDTVESAAVRAGQKSPPSFDD